MSEDDIRSLCGIFYNLPADELYSIDVHKFAFLSPIKGLCLLGAVDSICRSIIAVRVVHHWHANAPNRFFSSLMPSSSQYQNQHGGWSPQGGLLQFNTTTQAVESGSATAGLKSDTHAVLVALKEAPSVLSVPEKKIIPIDKHVGISFAGLAAHARQLSDSMQTKCQKNRATYDTPLSISDLGPHIYQACSPSGDTFECKAMAIGDRSQSACTYLEEHLDEFKLCNLEDLVKHGLRALRSCLPTGGKLTAENVSIAIVSQNENFTIYEDKSVAPYDQQQQPSDDDAPPPAAAPEDKD
ncbi:hypothetical protein HPB52_012743 [Rhipicephalus sanguineus]|uniref:Uncharacterized protein n=1 Tax=Rhipicephalus sanguineus TaxID=34632 RepID=A0A9D4SP45_RHISA|nr:hypothetical protein HPB52_012743 [Rhipicephalus sanguineus]